MRGLDSYRPSAQRKAAASLAALGGSDIEEILVETLNEEYREREARVAAARGLATLGSRSAADALFQAVGESDRDISLAAAEGLAALPGPAGTAGLLRGLGARAHDTCVVCAKALAERGQPDWLEAVKDDPDERYVVLASQGDPAIVPALLLGLVHDYSYDEGAAHGLIPYLRAEHIPALMAELARGDGIAPEEVEEGVVTALLAVGPEAVPPLLGALDAPAESVRGIAARALGLLGDSRAVLPLTERLTDEELWVRRRAVVALGLLRAEEAQDALLAAADIPDLRSAALEALSRIGDARAAALLRADLDALLAGLSSPDSQLTGGETLVDCLARLLDREATGSLLKIVESLHHSWLVRETEAYAAWAASRGSRESERERLETAWREATVNPSVARAAIRALGRLGAPEAVGPLIELLDEIPEMLARSISDLAEKLPDSDPEGRPVAYCREQADYLRAATAVSLGRLGDTRAVQPIIRCLDGASALLARDCVDSLAELGMPEGLDAIMDMPEASEEEHHADVQALGLAKVCAAWLYGHPAGRGHLVNFLFSAEEKVRKEAFEYIELDWGEGMAEAHIKMWRRWRQYADDGKPDCPDYYAPQPPPDAERSRELTQRLRRAGYVDNRDALARELARAEGPSAADTVAAAMGRPSRWVAYAAAEALGERGDKRALRLLGTATDHSSSLRAVRALAKLGSEREARKLLAQLGGLGERRSDMEASGRWARARALAKLCEHITGGELQEVLPRGDAYTRGCIVYLLGKLGARLLGEQDPLPDAEGDGVPQLRAALHALMLEPFTSALRDPHPQVRWEAARALRGLRLAEAFPHLVDALSDPHPRVRQEAATALGGGHVESVPQLLKALADPEPDVRWAAIGALGSLGDESAVPPLAQLLQDGNENDHVRRSAAAALGNIGGAEAVKALRAAAASAPSDLKRECEEALKRIPESGDEQSV